MRNYQNICIIIVVITAILLISGCTEGQTNPNAAMTYEPLFNEVCWCETNMPDFDKTLFIGNENSPPESCTVLFEKMKLLDMEMPLDSEDRIIAYAWELARMMDDCENIEDTEWYVISAYHYPEGVWLIDYAYRSNVTKMPDGTIRIPYGGSLTLVVSENDGEILNAVYIRD